jgi:hypothetical protein
MGWRDDLLPVFSSEANEGIECTSSCKTRRQYSWEECFEEGSIDYLDCIDLDSEYLFFSRFSKGEDSLRKSFVKYV